MMRGTFAGPRILHVHGAFALAWVLLFVAQPLLVRRRAFSVHRMLGCVGLPLAFAIAGTMIPVGLYQATRDADAGLGSIAISSLLGVLTSAMLFVALVTAGVVARRDRKLTRVGCSWQHSWLFGPLGFDSATGSPWFRTQSSGSVLSCRWLGSWLR